MTLDFASESVSGMRAENQDRVIQFESPFGAVFMLADGMGGHQGGAIASSIAISNSEEIMRSLPGSLAPDAALAQVIQTVNRRILEESRNGDKSLRRMGSTVVALLISETPDGWLAIGAHVGDSRLYFARGEKLFRLTEDHTVVQQLVSNNTLTQEQAQDHPNAGVLTRTLGHRESITVDLTPWMMLQPGDLFLLCSDGLSAYADDSAIHSAILRREKSAELAAKLVQLAYREGSQDNISVLVVQTAAGQPAPM